MVHKTYLTANSASSSEVARNSLAGWFCFMSFHCSADPPLRPRWTLGRCLLPGGEVFRYRSKIKNRYVLNIANQSFGAIAVIWCIKRTLPATLPAVPKRRGAVLQVGLIQCQFQSSADPSLRPRWTLGRCLLPGGEVFRYRSEIKNRYVLNIANQSLAAIAVYWHKHP